MLRVIRSLGRLFLWFNYMFPRSGRAIASGRQYREKNLFLEIFGAVRLIIALLFLIIYFCIINPIFTSKELNNIPSAEKYKLKIIENVHDNPNLLKRPKEIILQEVNKNKTLKQYDLIHNQIF